MPDKIIVSGIGCCLVDILYNDIDFGSETIRPFMSRSRGDGGLTPGQLVFNEEFTLYAKSSFDAALAQVTGGKALGRVNVGGPSIVPLIHVAQVVAKEHCEVRFYGRGGKDETGEYLLSCLKKTPVVLYDYKLIENQTPSTVVLSDPNYDNGHGERIFINSIGAASDYKPEDITDDFFDSDIVVLGGTALVPAIHDQLASLLKRAKSKGCVTIVNTVFDFRNEKSAPDKRWPLGESDDSYSCIDLLIADQEEALRLSGSKNPQEAIRFLKDSGVSSFIITNGSKNISAFSDGRFFNFHGLREYPVSKKVTARLQDNQGGDTTGCGDNFVGGAIASIVTQLHAGIKHPSLQEACCWGVVSGGFTCFYMGGTYFENEKGEKLRKIMPYYECYKKQISG